MKAMKRYNVFLPTKLIKQAKKEAKARDLSMAEFLRKCVKWGIVTLPLETISAPQETKTFQGLDSFITTGYQAESRK